MPDGTEATPSGYLDRLRLQNQVFGDDIELEGIVEPSFALIRIVTSQQAIQGRPAEMEEIEMFFCQHGFQRFVWRGKSAWFREVDRVICADTHGGNIMKVAWPQLMFRSCWLPLILSWLWRENEIQGKSLRSVRHEDVG